MTHRRILELAGRLCEHGVDVLESCRRISDTALTRYWKANDTRCHVWSDLLMEPNAAGEPNGRFIESRRDRAVPAVQEIATSGVLARVAGTILYAVGRRLDVPLAIDTADRTVQAIEDVRQAAVTAVARRSNRIGDDLVTLDRLQQLCDRLSDLLCGAIAAQLKCDRFVVDRQRAADFAETFGRRLGLVRVPVRTAFRLVPQGALAHSGLAEEVEHALLNCLPAVARLRSSSLDGLSDLEAIFRPRIARLSDQPGESPVRSLSGNYKPISFPTLSFAAILRRGSDAS